MGVVTGGGGATFTGGTITKALEIDNDAASHVALMVKGHSGQSVDLATVEDNAGHAFLEVGALGGVTVQARDPGQGTNSLQVNSDTNNQLAAFVVNDLASGLFSFVVGGDGVVTIQSLAATTTPLSLVAHTGQTGPLLVAVDENSTNHNRIAANGYLVIGEGVPTDADIGNGTAQLWFDSTNGASKLMVRAKSTNGTVVTGSLALA